MPPTPSGPTPARSAADVDAEIRALWVDGVLPGEQRREYERLVVAWAQADRAERAAHGGAELAA